MDIKMEKAIRKNKVKEYVEYNDNLYEILGEMDKMGVLSAISEIQEKELIKVKDYLKDIFKYVKDDVLKEKFDEIEDRDDLEKFIMNLERFTLRKLGDKEVLDENSENILKVIENFGEILKTHKPKNVEFEVYKDIYDISCKDDFDSFLFFTHLKSMDNNLLELCIKEFKVNDAVKNKLKL